MAQNRIGGPGLGLPYPQSLYPTSLIGAAPQAATNVIALAPGEALPIPPGDWMVTGAPMQFLDPVTNQWTFVGGATAVNEGYVHSDGQNHRVINPNQIVNAASITGAGSGYTPATPPTVTPSAGGSTYTPIIGGAVSLAVLPGTYSGVATATATGTGTVATITFAAQTVAPVVGNYVTIAGVTPTAFNGTYQITASSTTSVSFASTATGPQTVAGTMTTGYGYGYSMAPMVFISAPPSPGVQATATATINSAGIVTGVTVQAAGAGYNAVPTVMLQPNPYDPNFGSIVPATVTPSLTGAGTLTGLLVNWGGSPQGSAPTLALSGTATAGPTGFLTASTVLTAYLQPL